MWLSCNNIAVKTLDGCPVTFFSILLLWNVAAGTLSPYGHSVPQCLFDHLYIYRDVGYSGRRCSNDIDECHMNPCLHGNCTDLTNGYSCACEAGFVPYSPNGSLFLLFSGFFLSTILNFFAIEVGKFHSILTIINVLKSKDKSLE